MNSPNGQENKKKPHSFPSINIHSENVDQIQDEKVLTCLDGWKPQFIMKFKQFCTSSNLCLRPATEHLVHKLWAPGSRHGSSQVTVDSWLINSCPFPYFRNFQSTSRKLSGYIPRDLSVNLSHVGHFQCSYYTTVLIRYWASFWMKVKSFAEFWSPALHETRCSGAQL